MLCFGDFRGSLFVFNVGTLPITVGVSATRGRENLLAIDITHHFGCRHAHLSYGPRLCLTAHRALWWKTMGGCHNLDANIEIPFFRGARGCGGRNRARRHAPSRTRLALRSLDAAVDVADCGGGCPGAAGSQRADYAKGA